MSVNPTFASALKATALLATARAPSAGAWGDRAINSTILSPLEAKADAEAEAARQAVFLDGPKPFDEHIVPGRHHNLVARVITIVADRLGYEGGAAVFVLDADETAVEGATKLLVLKKTLS
jgi:hypothetical protein